MLRPHGIAAAKCHEKWRVLGSFGGWSLSGPEYLAFHRAFAPSGTLLTASSREWLVAGAGNGGVNDSVGTLAVTYAMGASLVAYYEPRPDDRSTLDGELARAIHAVRTWPGTDLYPRFGVVR